MNIFAVKNIVIALSESGFWRDWHVWNVYTISRHFAAASDWRRIWHLMKCRYPSTFSTYCRIICDNANKLPVTTDSLARQA